jgi:hypothetical protein
LGCQSLAVPLGRHCWRLPYTLACMAPTVNAIYAIRAMVYGWLMANENTKYPVKKFVRMTDEMAARIEKCRYDSRLPSENETIRRLIAAGLETLESGSTTPAVAPAVTPAADAEAEIRTEAQRLVAEMKQRKGGKLVAD